MRIICDHCSLPISGSVKRVPGNFNLHPDCQTQLDKQESLNQLRSHDGARSLQPAVWWTRKGTEMGVPLEME